METITFLLVNVLLLVVIPSLGLYVRSWVTTKVNPAKLGQATGLATIAVQAAEVVGKATEASGADKYEYAEQSLLELANRVGLKLKPEEANALIHAALGEVQAIAATTKEAMTGLYAQGFMDAQATVNVPEGALPGE